MDRDIGRRFSAFQGVWTTFTTANGLSGDRVTAIAPGRDGSMLVRKPIGTL